MIDLDKEFIKVGEILVCQENDCMWRKDFGNQYTVLLWADKYIPLNNQLVFSVAFFKFIKEEISDDSSFERYKLSDKTMGKLFGFVKRLVEEPNITADQLKHTINKLYENVGAKKPNENNGFICKRCGQQYDHDCHEGIIGCFYCEQINERLDAYMEND